MDERSKTLARRFKAQELFRNLIPVLGLLLLIMVFQSISGSVPIASSSACSASTYAAAPSRRCSSFPAATSSAS